LQRSVGGFALHRRSNPMRRFIALLGFGSRRVGLVAAHLPQREAANVAANLEK
jgi:hypothetical protein